MNELGNKVLHRRGVLDSRSVNRPLNPNCRLKFPIQDVGGLSEPSSGIILEK